MQLIEGHENSDIFRKGEDEDLLSINAANFNEESKLEDQIVASKRIRVVEQQSELTGKAGHNAENVMNSQRIEVKGKIRIRFYNLIIKISLNYEHPICFEMPIEV